MKKDNLNNDGFVLLYAVLVTMVVVTVGVLMINIVTRQIVLSSVARNSQVAFYAANAGVECVTYWNSQKLFGFDTETENGGSIFIAPTEQIDFACGDSNISISNTSISGGYKYRWSFLAKNGCVDVEVNMNNDGTNFLVKAEGYNSDLDGLKCKTANIGRLVQRTIVLEPASNTQ